MVKWMNSCCYSQMLVRRRSLRVQGEARPGPRTASAGCRTYAQAPTAGSRTPATHPQTLVCNDVSGTSYRAFKHEHSKSFSEFTKVKRQYPVGIVSFQFKCSTLHEDITRRSISQSRYQQAEGSCCQNVRCKCAPTSNPTLRAGVAGTASKLPRGVSLGSIQF